MYEVGDKVIVKKVLGFDRDEIVIIYEVDNSAFANGDEPYKITDGQTCKWVYESDIEPATVSLLCKWNEAELNEYGSSMLEEDNKKCIEFLLKNPSEYFSLEEIYKNVNISFTSLDTLKRELVHQSKFPFWKCEELGYEVMYKLKPNKKKYYGDDGSVLLRGKSEHYFCTVEKVKEVCDYDEKEECEEDE